ncbi:MAG TPA: sucrose synthase [Phycisphaerae bacterium]|nr:sucrose synthase [Phycisphaerae bacterium]
MKQSLVDYLREHRDRAYLLLRRYVNLGKPFLLQSDLREELRAFCAENHAGDIAESPLGQMVQAAQEAALAAPWMCLAARPRIGQWTYWRLHVEALDVDELSVSEFLAFKERLANGQAHTDEWPLEIDLGPFNTAFPRLKETRSIGHGVAFLNRKLSSELFQELDKGDRRLLEFLSVHQFQGTQLMLNRRIGDVPELRRAVRRADEYLEKQPTDACWREVGDKMQELGFEPGWGRTAERMRDTLRLLSEILEAPAPSVFEQFLSRLPMLFNIAIISPHGYFGQSDVLGLPDTGGQVVYILDQVRALEKEMRLRLEEQGIELPTQILVITRLIPEARGTTCDQPAEHIMGTTGARILRVPFRDEAGDIVPHWISRFKVWPYLERFALEAEKTILAELGGRPGLIIGNYSDGCLVASLLSRHLHVTQCNIAHALEKTKYLLSDLFWRDNEERYHFACQFTADLISMNSADFIITSTYHEIAGTSESVGQYESYGAFTMPGLHRVVNGIDIFDPKFNIVSPGADPDIYFPHSDNERRLKGLHAELEALVFGDAGGGPHRGTFSDRDKPIVFTMARLDRIKNINGLVDAYGQCPQLRELANLLVVGGDLDPDRSADHEEREQIEWLHELIDRHDLETQIRWVGFQSERNLVGELYRYVADTRGVFVHPALFEAFGLCVIEAMASGLPTFATCYGGPSEIIEDGVSGFHIDPNHGDVLARSLVTFLEQCAKDPHYWGQISQGGIERVAARYTWELYGRRMMTLARVYGFWKYVTNLERAETHRYLDMFYGLQYRRLAESMAR